MAGTENFLANSGLVATKIKAERQTALIIAGTETRPSKPSVRLTAFEAPTITKVTNKT